MKKFFAIVFFKVIWILVLPALLIATLTVLGITLYTRVFEKFTREESVEIFMVYVNTIKNVLAQMKQLVDEM